MDCTPEEVRNYVIYQIGALQAFCTANKVELRHVKPHGNLYMTAVENENVARAIAQAIVAVDPRLMYVALAGAKGELIALVAQEVGLKVVFEAFPDRAYTSQGTLLSRREPGAVIQDPKIVANRALKMAKEKRIVAVDGSEIIVEAQTLCVHGDNPKAVELVRAIRETLETNGVEVKPIERDDQ